MKIQLSPTKILEVSSKEDILDQIEIRRVGDSEQEKKESEILKEALKQEEQRERKGKRKEKGEDKKPQFKKGDKVLVKHSPSFLERTIREIGGNNQLFRNTAGTLGVVNQEDNERIIVTGTTGIKYTYLPEALERGTLKKGDRCIVQYPKTKQYKEGVVWAGPMGALIGQEVTVEYEVQEAAYQCVTSSGTCWSYHREWLSLLEDSGAEQEPQEGTQDPEQVEIELTADLYKMFGDQFDEFFRENATLFTDDRLKDLLNNAIQKLRPVEVIIPERPKVEMKERLHKAFEECLILCQLEKQIFIAGPAGSGKTTLASQLAKAMSMNFSSISCSSGLSEAHLLGRMLFDGTYVGTDFVRLYEEGGIFLFDEVDAADANTMLVINSALANGAMGIPNRKDKPFARRHPEFVCIVSGNTWGGGSHEYHGRNHLDAAFLDRFAVSRVQIDYDKELEIEIGNGHGEYVNTIHKIRQRCVDKKIRRVVSTRAIISGVRQLKAGKSQQEVLDRLFVGWSNEERQKAQN